MQIEDAKPGTRVYHEPDNNGPIWRGTIVEHSGKPTIAGDCVLVKWDGEPVTHVVNVAVLSPQH